LFYQIEDVKLKEFASGEETTNKVLIADVMDTEKQLVVGRALSRSARSVARQLIDLGVDKVKVVDISRGRRLHYQVPAQGHLQGPGGSAQGYLPPATSW